MTSFTPRLKTLRLSGILETLDARVRQAASDGWSHTEFLERLLEDECDRRAHKHTALRVRRANLHPDKTLERFDFSFNPQLNKPVVHTLATCQFVARHEAVLLVGPSGTGKSHLAHALGHEACRKGHDVLFVNASRMLAQLAAARADGSYARRMQGLLRVGLLILDDFGLKPLRPPAPEDFYDLISERYEKAATLITSNRALSEFPQIFGDPLLASAGLDRLFHNAHVVTLTGTSFRARNRIKDLQLPAKEVGPAQS
jgi:DNA replication protein DnaC